MIKLILNLLTLIEMEGDQDYQNELLMENEKFEDLFALFKFRRNLDSIWIIPSELSFDDIQGYVSVLKDCLSLTLAGKKKKTAHNGEPKKRRKSSKKDDEFSKTFISAQVITFL